MTRSDQRAGSCTVRITPEQDAALQVLRARTRPISTSDLGEALFVAGLLAARGRGVVKQWLGGLSDAGLARSIVFEPAGGRPRLMWSVATGVKRVKFCVYRRGTTPTLFRD